MKLGALLAGIIILFLACLPFMSGDVVLPDSTDAGDIGTFLASYLGYYIELLSTFMDEINATVLSNTNAHTFALG